MYKADHNPIRWPEGVKNRIFYIFLIPLTHAQWLTIPNPMGGLDESEMLRRENFWPLTLFLASLWIWFYTFLIVWWTYTVTQAYKLHFSILPMILYPFGIAMRD